MNPRGRVLTLAAVVLVAGAAADLTGTGRLPFDHLRWRAGTPEIEVGGGWVPLRAVQGVPAAVLVADEVAAAGPAFLDRFAFDLDHLVRRHGARWGPIVTLDVEDAVGPRRIHRLATRTKGRRLTRRLDDRTESAPDAIAEPVVTRRIDRPPRWPRSAELTVEAARHDLGVLAWHLGHRLASPRTDVPWRQAIAAILRRTESGVSRRDFAIQVMSVLALFEDGHTRLKRTDSRIRLSRRVLPVRLVAVEEGVACVTPDETQFCSPAYPLVSSIDGHSLAALAARLAPLVPRVSPDVQQAGILDLIREVDVIHGLAGSRAGHVSMLLLGDAEGRTASRVVHPQRGIRDRPRASIDVRILSSADGYLGLRRAWPPGESFRRELDDAFRVVQDTPGLVIDVRGNQGGDREPVLHLLRHLVAGDTVIDLAAYRMSAEERPVNALNVLGARRFTPPGTAWSGLASVREQWALPPADWSDWHVARLGAAGEQPIYRGPILLLIDERSASATALLASVLAPLDRVRTAGMEGGGGGGWPVDVRLPNSGVIVSVPAMLAVEPGGRPRRAIVPEAPHRRTLDDLVQEVTNAQPVPSWVVPELRALKDRTAVGSE